MGVTAVVLVALGVLVIGYLAWVRSRSEPPAETDAPPTDTELMQARLDLQRIERGVDLTLAREEARREGQRTKDAIAEALAVDDESAR
jgi:hypothetical protein